MRVFIVANFANAETSRFFYLARMLANKGHDVTVITSNFSHSLKSLKNNKPQYDGFKTIYLHEPGYKSNVSINRLWSHYVWGKNVGKYLKKAEMPDVVYCAIPSLTVAVEASEYCCSA